MTLPEVIKLTRQKSFMTQDEFAKEMKVSALTVTRWENGKCKPNLTAMKNLKQFCISRDLPFDIIESAWLGYTQGGKND